MDINEQLGIWRQMYDRIRLLLEEEKAICNKLRMEIKNLKERKNDKS